MTYDEGGTTKVLYPGTRKFSGLLCTHQGKYSFLSNGIIYLCIKSFIVRDRLLENGLYGLFKFLKLKRHRSHFLTFK